MRLVLSFAAFIVCISAGYIADTRMKDRANKLNTLCTDVRTFCDSMELSQFRLNEMLSALNKSAMAKLWNGFALRLEANSISAREAWNEAVECENKNGCLMGLDAQDAEALLSLGEAFSAISRRAQTEYALLTLKRLEQRAKNAENIRESKGKLYSSLGVLMGFAAAILIM